MKRIIASASLAAAVIAGIVLGMNHADAAGKKIIIATEGAYAPFNFVAPDGSLQGFDVDIAKAVCEKMKADCQIIKQDWDGMIPGLQAKKFDAIVASMSITEERKQKIDFSQKYYNTAAILAAKDGTPIKIDPATGNPDPASLKGMKIGVQRATTHEKYARAKFPGAEIVVYDTADNRNLDLTTGRLDAALDDSVVLGDEIVKKNPGFKFFGKGYYDPEFFGIGAGIGVRKEDTELRDAFTKAIKEIREDGTYKKINDKYFSFDVYGPAS